MCMKGEAGGGAFFKKIARHIPPGDGIDGFGRQDVDAMAGLLQHQVATAYADRRFPKCGLQGSGPRSERRRGATDRPRAGAGLAMKQLVTWVRLSPVALGFRVAEGPALFGGDEGAAAISGSGQRHHIHVGPDATMLRQQR